MISFLQQEQAKLITHLKVCCARAKLENMDMDDWRDEVGRLYGYVMYEDRSSVNHRR